MVGLGFPLPGWVVTPSGGNILNITVNDYDTDDPDLELIRVQYRRTIGDGAWINIAELQKNELGDVFTIVPWDTQGLQDGLYEIRSVSQCFGAQNPGLSDIIKGRIERTPPRLFGLPQPADGVLSPGDEISITFNEPIRCDLLIQADVFNNNNIGLYNTATGELIDAVISCSEDKIVVVPNVLNQFIENQILRVVVEDVEDLAGNLLEEPVSWEFFVNRSTLFWQNARIHEMVEEGDELIVERDIKNQGGIAMDYSLENIPGWMTAFPSTGTVLPGEVRTVTFTFASDLVAKFYEQEVVMSTPEGDEPLDVVLRVTCPDPGWAINAADYLYSMNMTLELDIEGEIADDMLDQVGAFVEGELRGVAPVMYSEELDKYLAFLTVFSNEVDNETVTFEIWDASTCILYGSTYETFPFEADGLVGTPLVPQKIHTNNMVQRSLQLVPGWNWISYNVALPDSSINTVLGSLTAPGGAIVKGQAAFSQYFSAADSWIGSLNNLSHRTMYQYRSEAIDSLRLLGMLVNPALEPLQLEAGWNWLSYLPRQGMNVNDALAALTPLNGDIIKGQATFAQYVAGVGWIGNLNFMLPGRGYLLNLSNPDILYYPQSFTGGSELEYRGALVDARPDQPTQSSYWEVDPYEYEFSMNLIAIVQDGALGNCLNEAHEVGAFADDELRGANKPLYIEELDAWLLFLTVYSDTEGGEPISFKLYDASTSQEFDINEQMIFIANRIDGTLESPVVLTLNTTVDAEEAWGSPVTFNVFPNPARDQVFVEYQARSAGTHTIMFTDALGRQVKMIKQEANRGVNLARWSAHGLPAGLYQVSLITPQGQVNTQLLELN
jgi:hypothetical protein